MRSATWAPILAAAVIAVVASGPTWATEATFVDDLGVAIHGPLRVCRVSGLDQDCEDVVLTGAPLEVAGFELLQVSGPEHGPARFRTRPGDGVFRLPRKAYLSIDRTRGDRSVTASLYAVDDPGFRRPSERFEMSSPEALRIPAGSWLLSLARGDGAPDLHVLTAAPAERLRVTHRERPGWSAVVVVTDGATGAPVAEAKATLGPTPGFGDGPPRSTRTGPTGLAAFSGLSFELADVALEHERLLPARASAISATPGSFAVRQVELSAGGEVTGRVTLDGEPAAGARWVLRVPAEDGRQLWQEIVSGDTDGDGTFRAGPLPPGLLSLQVVPSGFDVDPRAAPRGIAGVRVVAGESTHTDLPLVRHTIAGEVRVDGEPAAGYRVSVGHATTGSTTNNETVASVIVDEAGEFEAVVWEDGEHIVTVSDDADRFVETDLVWVGRDGGRVDFDLDIQRVTGSVVDAAGQRLPEASVHVRWDRKLFLAKVDDQGRFVLPLNGSGTAEIGAYLEGHAEPEPVFVEVASGQSPPPVELRFGPPAGLVGTVLAASGPAAGVRVSAFVADGERLRGVGAAVSDPDGRFRIRGDARGPAQLFFSGPGCPLTSRVETVGGGRPLELRCAAVGGNLVLHVEDGSGGPGAGIELTVARAGVAVPRDVLAAHLAALGLGARTNGAGGLVLAALEPGSWEVFLAEGSNAATIRAGLGHGFLAATEILPRATVELEVVAER